jgi:hypothetical protein
MDIYFFENSKPEREFQQSVDRENNFSGIVPLSIGDWIDQISLLSSSLRMYSILATMTGRFFDKD